MTRDEAKEILAHYRTKELTPEERKALLLDWWTIGPDDPGYADLPRSLRAELASQDQPSSAAESRYDPLLEVAIRRSLVGVTNSYLERSLVELHIEPPTVEGQPERMVACPCCGYQSLGKRGQYEICKVCFWEDDGTDDLDRPSGPNRMTLREASENFRRMGAMSEQARSRVLPDGKERYSH